MLPQFNNTAELAFRITDIVNALCMMADSCADSAIQTEINSIADRLGLIADKLDMELEYTCLMAQDTRAEGRVH